MSLKWNLNAGYPLYYFGNWLILSSQLRKHCSNIHAHLVSLHVLDDPICLCSNGTEDNELFFVYCPLYYTYRLKVINIMKQVEIVGLNTLLYGDANLDVEQNCIIFKAVHEFIFVSSFL